MGDRMQKTWDIRTVERYSAIKKDEMPFATTRLDLETILQVK